MSPMRAKIQLGILARLSSSSQLHRQLVMPLNQRPHVYRGNFTFTHHHAAIDDGVVRVVARAQQQRTHRVMHGTTSHAEGVGAPKVLVSIRSAPAAR